MEDLIGFLIFIYFMIIPFICKIMWEEDESDKSFIKWYFTKSEGVNWLGYFIFFMLGLGCTIWILLRWLFEFLFLNKDCSYVICKDLKKYNKEEESIKDICMKFMTEDEYEQLYRSSRRFFNETEERERLKEKGERYE